MAGCSLDMALELVARPGQTRTRGRPQGGGGGGPLWAGRWDGGSPGGSFWGSGPFQKHRRDSGCQPPISQQRGAPRERVPDVVALTCLGRVPAAALCLDLGLWCGFCPVFEQSGLGAPHTWPQLWLQVSLINSHRCFGASWTERTWDRWGLLGADGHVCTCVSVPGDCWPGSSCLTVTLCLPCTCPVSPACV